MTRITIEFEEFARVYFLAHCRQNEGFTWEALTDDARDFWRMTAKRKMWSLFTLPEKVKAA